MNPLEGMVLNASKKDYVRFRTFLESTVEEMLSDKIAEKEEIISKSLFSEKISDKDKDYDEIEPNSEIEKPKKPKKGEKAYTEAKEEDNKKKFGKNDDVEEEEDADGEDSEDDKEDME